MKVLLVSFSELPTLQRHLYVLSSELEKLGIDAFTIGSRNVRIDAGLHEHNYLVETPTTPKPSLSSFAAMNRSLDELARIAAKVSPDVVHFTNKHTWNYFLIKKLKKRLPKAVFVHTFHDPVGHDGDSVQKGVILYHKLVQRLLSGVVVHSSIARSQAIEQLRTKCPVFQVPLGEKPWRPFTPDVSGCREALVFGRLNPYKGLKYYPRILDEMYRLDPSLHVTVAGKASEEINFSLLEEIDSRPNCTLVNGFIEEADIDAYFARAGVVLVPYTSITQSGVILDAYSRSRPVVAFDIPGMQQYVPDRGSRVPAFDCAAFAQRIVELLDDPKARERAARDAWGFGRDHFSPKNMAEATKNVYMELVES